MGYSGGTLDNPDYSHIGDHTESIQIDYDPSKITYAALLDVFWNGHNASARSYSTQYDSIIFYQDEQQQRQAVESRDRIEAETGREIYTRIEPASTFYLAEDYHQKYYLRHFSEIVREFRAIYPDENDFINSTAVARVNGFAAGYGSEELLRETPEKLGLSPDAVARLQDITRNGLVSVCPVAG